MISARALAAALGLPSPTEEQVAVIEAPMEPVLVVAGGRDGFTPPDRSRVMIDQVPGCQGLEIEDGSHTAPIERPERVNGAITSFLADRVDAKTALS